MTELLLLFQQKELQTNCFSWSDERLDDITQHTMSYTAAVFILHKSFIPHTEFKYKSCYGNESERKEEQMVK